MAAVAACLWRGKILVEMDKACAGNVRLLVGAAARFDIRKIVTAVADDPGIIVEVRRELGYREESGMQGRIEENRMRRAAPILLNPWTRRMMRIAAFLPRPPAAPRVGEAGRGKIEPLISAMLACHLCLFGANRGGHN